MDKKENKVVKGVCLKMETAAMVEADAVVENRSESNVLRIIIEEYYKRKKKERLNKF